MKTFLSLLLIMLPLIGIADAGYITYEKFSGVIPLCGAGFDCGTVLTSQWASIGPVPVSVLGLVFYATVLILASAHLLELSFFSQKQRQIAIRRPTLFTTFSLLYPLDLLIIISSIGAVFSLFLVFLMAFVLQAWCLYCLISAATSFFIFIATQLLMKVTKYDCVSLKLWVQTTIAWKYQHLLKPIFFLLDAEVVHNAMLSMGEWLGSNTFGKQLTKLCFGYNNPVLNITVDGIAFPSPLGLAAGFDYNGQLTQILPSLGFGFHTIGTVTFRPYQGNSGIRLDRLPSSRGLLINKGLKSIGAAAVVKKLEKLPLHIPTGISIASTNQCYDTLNDQLLDIAQSFMIFEKSSVQHAYYEMNISCPNTFGGEPFTSPERLELLLQMLDRLTIKKPLYLKMPIDQSEKETLLLAKVADTHAVAGIIFGNLTKDKNNPLVTPADRAKWQQQPGNVSGKPTWERSNNLLKLIKKHYGTRFTLIGTGGIFSPQDFAKKQELGADLSQLITGMIFQGPQLIGSINAWLTLKKQH